MATTARATAVRRGLQLKTLTPVEVDAEVRRFCSADWRPRADIVQHLRDWLAEHESPTSAAAVAGTFGESLVWGNSGLARRPRGSAWETRTDTWHRTADSLVEGLEPIGAAAALVQLVRRHLAAHGPVTRRDLSFFFGVGLTQVDAAVSQLGTSWSG